MTHVVKETDGPLVNSTVKSREVRRGHLSKKKFSPNPHNLYLVKTFQVAKLGIIPSFNIL